DVARCSGGTAIRCARAWGTCRDQQEFSAMRYLIIGAAAAMAFVGAATLTQAQDEKSKGPAPPFGGACRSPPGGAGAFLGSSPPRGRVSLSTHPPGSLPWPSSLKWRQTQPPRRDLPAQLWAFVIALD